jgi:hypothetical protein
MDKRIVINQPAGLGDILFCQKIKKTFENEGFEVVWPVIKEYSWVKEYLEGNYIDNNIFKSKSNDIIIDLSNANYMFPNKKIMEAKYFLVDIDYSDWIDFFNFKRNTEKENKLYYDILGLKDDEEYVLVSRNYGSPPNFLKFPIETKSNIKNIELDFYNDFTLFDWCKVMENAKEIHMIDSSINFILEKINTNVLYLYTRRKNNFSEIDYLFKKDYIKKYD